MTTTPGPHQTLPIVTRGEADHPSAAMVMVHGRGDSAEGILSLAGYLTRPGWLYVAPRAATGAWYPHRFLEPVAVNEPWLSSALAAVGDAFALAERAGVARDRAVLLGFSQGACLALEYAARTGGVFGGVAALSGGLIGDRVEAARYRRLDGSPVFLGCSDPDPHIPRARVEESARLLESLGARVDMRFYPRLGHTVNEDEIEAVRAMMGELD